MDIEKLFKKSEILAPYTTWNIGGEAELFWAPEYEKLTEVLSYCERFGIPVTFLGRGSNTLISSDGIKGLVICTKRALLDIKLDNQGYIIAQAGVPMPKLSKFASNMGWGGYEYLIGIPGTVGAGIAINAGLTAKGRKEIGDVLLDVKVMNNKGESWWENSDELDLGYRSSNIEKRGLFIIEARFKPTYKTSKEEIKHFTAEHLAERRRKQPLSKQTAGSTFKQPDGGRPAGWYIDKTKLKGYKIGNAKISEKHANWIENTGGASDKDVLNLISYVQKEVKIKFNVDLIPEVKYLK